MLNSKTKNIGLLKPKRQQKKRPRCNEIFQTILYQIKYEFLSNCRPVVVLPYHKSYPEEKLKILFRHMTLLQRQGFRVQLM